MGRYYSGDIEGKFWFAVQSSNAADRFGGIVKPYYFEDKRKSTKYVLAIAGVSISPVLDYENLNYFILGFIKAKKIA